MNIVILDIIGIVFLVASVISVVLIRRHIIKRLDDIDGFGGIVPSDDSEQNIIGVFGEEEKG